MHAAVQMPQPVELDHDVTGDDDEYDDDEYDDDPTTTTTTPTRLVVYGNTSQTGDTEKIASDTHQRGQKSSETQFQVRLL